MTISRDMDMRVSISNFDQMLRKRKSQTRQVFHLAILLFLKLFVGTTFCENGQKLKNQYQLPSLFNSLEMLSSVSDKAKKFSENFSKNTNLDDSGISLPVFPSWTNLKLHNISVTWKMVKKVIMNLDLSKACCLVFQIVGRFLQWSYSSCDAWYIQGFWQDLACWSSSQT